jgi:hypothetical protein
LKNDRSSLAPTSKTTENSSFNNSKIFNSSAGIAELFSYKKSSLLIDLIEGFRNSGNKRLIFFLKKIIITE